MAEIEHAPLRHHGVEIEVLLKPFPKLHGKLVEGIVPKQHVIGADDRCIPPDVAGTKPALLEHRHIAEAKFLGEIIGRRQAMAAAAHDNNVIGRLRRRIAPGRHPVLMAAQRILEQRKDGVFHAWAAGMSSGTASRSEVVSGEGRLTPAAMESRPMLAGARKSIGPEIIISNPAWCHAPIASSGGNTGSIHCA